MTKRFLHIVCVGLFGALLLSACQDVNVTARTMHKSAKRGVSFNFTNIEDLPLLSQSCSWAYNWGNSQNETAALWFDTNDMDYCPMAWNAGYNKETIRQYVAAHPNTKYLLGYNEPNLTDQANMTPQQAAQSWSELVAFAKELGLQLVSPAMNYGTLSGYSDPIKWLDEFFALPNVSLDDVCAIAVHCYMSSPSAVKNYIDMFKKYGKPIWLTEFCAWDPVPGNVEKQMDYMCTVLNYLEQEKAVERYAWFMPRTSSAIDKAPYMQLLTHTSPVELTELGQLFVHFSSFDKKANLSLKNGIGAHQYVGISNNATVLRMGDSKPYIQNWQEGTSIDYQVAVERKADMTLTYATVVNSQMNIYVDGSLKATVDLPRTGSMTAKNTLNTGFVPATGYHTLRLEMVKGAANVYELKN